MYQQNSLKTKVLRCFKHWLPAVNEPLPFHWFSLAPEKEYEMDPVMGLILTIHVINHQSLAMFNQFRMSS